MTETRKLAAILAADVVGYSRLMDEDEVWTARAVREHRSAAAPLVASKGGRIVKTTGEEARARAPADHRRGRRRANPQPERRRCGCES
jgi:adenylate cyclase